MTSANFHPVYIDVQDDARAARVSLKLARLTEDENIELLGRELFTLVEQFGAANVILSLNNVQYATSAFLGKLITLHRKLHRKLHRRRTLLLLRQIRRKIRDTDST